MAVAPVFTENEPMPVVGQKHLGSQSCYVARAKVLPDKLIRLDSMRQ
jgi:hypothetical protein